MNEELLSMLTTITPLTSNTGEDARPDTMLLFWSMLLIGGMMIFLLLEAFIPSGGFLAILAAGCAIGSIVTTFMFNDMLGFAVMIGYVLLTPMGLYWGVRLWKNSSLGRHWILGAENEGIDENAPNPGAERMRIEKLTSIKNHIGQTGVTDSLLRPVGFVMIEGQRIDAIAEGDMIESNRNVLVVDAYDNQLKVREIDPSESSGPSS
jgi:membrane-bound serine protease (ClpP class)